MMKSTQLYNIGTISSISTYPPRGLILSDLLRRAYSGGGVNESLINLINISMYIKGAGLLGRGSIEGTWQFCSFFRSVSPGP
jgi:hypothetical protein